MCFKEIKYESNIENLSDENCTFNFFFQFRFVKNIDTTFGGGKFYYRNAELSWHV